MRAFLPAALVFFAGLVASPTTVLARDLTSAPCMQRATSNTQFAACTGSLVKDADMRLNASWKRLLALVGGSKTPRGAALLNEQRAWIAFREKACTGFWQDQGREAQVLHGPLCIAQIIDDRATDLSTRVTQLTQDQPN
jgi:uncharacterized protein YecT (DUF1311 family)